ncbi:glycosyltransferase [Aeromicrobium sp. 9AM]|uniref:glycosyltransferase n=1 Tax=Aeromicrobium sp. 9AM TaxID=2653126 RepID=UPI0012F1FCA9|nr:glycosyltransferase [Aeromicrobium sp. 9AM]VXB47342.1 Glycosyltransferase involved in cell wall biosynthesis [Aeromicrobium sp. 9AM]
MRIVVDAMCAEFGGIRTYAEHLLDQWGEFFPDDELHVLVPEDSTLPMPGHTRHAVRVGRPSAVRRPWAQTRHVRRLVRQVRPDVVLATLPSTTLLRPGPPMAMVLYDLRHEMRPEQFTRAKRLMRRVSYGRGYRTADGMLSISQRSLDDLYERHPHTRAIPSAVAHLGADHVTAWPAARTDGPAITFAHHTNKNVDLVLNAWQSLVAAGGRTPRLLMLGVPGAQRERLKQAIADRGLTDAVELAPFLPDDEFVRVMAEAEMIVFPSDFEGFGLPVAEGMRLGKAVVIGPERATIEVAGGHAFVMKDWTADALADAVRAAEAMTDEQRAAARGRGEEFTWESTIRRTRGILEALVERQNTGSR